MRIVARRRGGRSPVAVGTLLRTVLGGDEPIEKVLDDDPVDSKIPTVPRVGLPDENPRSEGS